MEVKLFECPDQLTAKLTLQRLTRRNGISCCGRPGRRRPDSRVQAPPRAHRPAPDCRGRLRPRWSCGCSPTRWLGRYIPAGWSRESDTACPCHPDSATAPGRRVHRPIVPGLSASNWLWKWARASSVRRRRAPMRPSDDLVFEKATSQRTAALLANLSGSKLCFIDVAGRLGAGLAEEGET